MRAADPGAPEGTDAGGTSARARREQQAYDDAALWERSHRAHVRFLHVFECPNTTRANRRFDDILRESAAGRRVLDVGCGDGSLSRLARQSGAASVLGLDVSERFLAAARAHAEPGRVEFLHHDIAQPIDGRFDLIAGSAVLHHVDYRAVLARLYEENLAPGGRMLFREPLGANLLIRAWWWYGRSAHSADERPFMPRDLRWLRARFPTLRVHGVNYLSLPAGIVSSLVGTTPDSGLLRWCDEVDHWLDSHAPWLVPRFRYAIITIEKPR